jgi:hypothetical protein
MAEETNDHRRRSLETAAITIAATQLGIIGYAAAQPGRTRPADLPKIIPGTYSSFASLKQIQAGALNVGYATTPSSCTLGLRSEIVASAKVAVWAVADYRCCNVRPSRSWKRIEPRRGLSPG